VSASTGAAGSNSLGLTGITVVTSILQCLWLRVNSWTKTPAYGIAQAIGGVPGGNAIAVGLLQGGAGTGGESRLDAIWYNAGFNSILTSAITTLSTWYFVYFSVTGTTNAAVDFYRGTESPGSLTLNSATSNFGANQLDYTFLGGDNGGAQLTNVSMWGARTWLNVTHTRDQVVQEWSSRTGAPVNTTGLLSYLPIATGTNPEVAATGTNFVRTGTLTTDASNPVPPNFGPPPGIFTSGTRGMLTGHLPHHRMSEHLARERRLRAGADAAEVVHASKRAQQSGRAFSFLSAP
jgi:hypothetical protein